MMNIEKVRETLSPYLEKTVKNYEAFLCQSCPTDAKGMTAYQNACKAALTHIALLMKIIEGNQDDSIPEEKALNEWIKKAQNASDLQEDIDVEFD